MTDRAGRRVLVLEDDERVRSAMCDYLAELGYLPEGAASGNEAITCFERETFRLVVADYRMPGLNGLDAVKRMRMLNPTVPVLMVTGYAKEFGWEAHRLGISVLPKPIDFDVFAQILQGIAA